MPFDPTSQSNLDEVKTNHIHLTLDVDFAAKILTGSVNLEVEAIADNVVTVVLDTSYIDVRSASAANQKLNVIQCLQSLLVAHVVNHDELTAVISSFNLCSSPWASVTKSSALHWSLNSQHLSPRARI